MFEPLQARGPDKAAEEKETDSRSLSGSSDKENQPCLATVLG